ncbi:MAG: exodeoxyribonuclease VII large subunit [Bacteroidetes bacterium 4572_77]|nr:MAG: exodeoxyribonuclease VII large subunit [Bacteroidetes bacterium 4572_77]
MDEFHLVIRSTFDSTYWVVAEVANVSGSAQGHMYFELVEKQDQQIIAKARANLWSYKKSQIIGAFQDITQESIKSGMKLLLQLSVEFHSVYGLSFQIHDIDPAYSLGELERQRQETIKQLESEGLLDFNKQYVLNEVVRNIAVISSKTAAGYQDFINQLTNNEYGYTFDTQLFKATMQGEKAPKSIFSAIEKIDRSKKYFDAVVIIRGGGSNLDLACFDDYELNARLAQSFFPVLTGIGHERDTSITDMIAHTRLKTPTAVASFIIDRNHQFEGELENSFQFISNYSLDYIHQQQSLVQQWTDIMVSNIERKLTQAENQLKSTTFLINKGSINLIHENNINLKQQKANLRMASMRYREQQKYELKHHISKLTFACTNLQHKQLEFLAHKKQEITNTTNYTEKENNKLNYYKHLLKLSDPQSILNRGFSITRKNGKAIQDLSKLKLGDKIETQIAQGRLHSTITKKDNNNE